MEEDEGPWGGSCSLPPTSCLAGSWRRDVGLECKGSPEGAEARAWTAYHYSLLQSCLQQAGLPETQDRSQVPRTGAQGLRGGQAGEVGTLQPGQLCVPTLPRWSSSHMLAGWEVKPGQPRVHWQAAFQR